MSLHGLSLIALLAVAVPGPAHAAEPQLLTDFRTARGKLTGKIDDFLKAVDACNPPVKMVKDQIMNGFGGAQDDSAKNLLALSEKNVAAHVASAEAALGEVDGALATCTDRAKLLDRSNRAGAEVAANLAGDAADLKKGMVEAARKKSLLLAALDLRQKGMDGHLPIPAGDVASCTVAKDLVKEMEESNAALAASLAKLQDSYARKVTFQAAAISAPAACHGGIVHSAGFEAEEAPATEPDGGVTAI